MSKKKIDWNIHAVYDDNDANKPIDIHTHGLKKHGIKNICMECPSMDLVNYCSVFINSLAEEMIAGEKYTVGQTQLIDNIENYNLPTADVYHVFDLREEIRYNGEGPELCLVIDYWFDKVFLNPYNLLPYKFDAKEMQWKNLDKIR